MLSYIILICVAEDLFWKLCYKGRNNSQSLKGYPGTTSSRSSGGVFVRFEDEEGRVKLWLMNKMRETCLIYAKHVQARTSNDVTTP